MWKYLQESLVLNHETGDIPGLTASLASFAKLAIQLGPTITLLDETAFNSAFTEGWEMSEEDIIKRIERSFSDKSYS